MGSLSFLLVLTCFALGTSAVTLLPKFTPQGYVCRQASGPIVIDGSLNDAAWSFAPWTPLFIDANGDAAPKPRYKTQAKMLWTPKALYVGAWLEEPLLQANFTEHDSELYKENAFEVFVDPDGDSQLYTEVEVNALNTNWDLLLAKPYDAGGVARLDGWEVAGMKTAVKLDGKLNNPSVKSKGWTVEIVLPWKSICQSSTKPCPPAEGDVWRMNFQRKQYQWVLVGGKLVYKPGTKDDNWVWSAGGNIHRPERWGYVQFTTQTKNSPALKPFAGWQQQQVLGDVWDKENAYRQKNGVYTPIPKKLGLAIAGLTIQVTDNMFEATYERYKVDQNLRFWQG